MCSGVIIFPIKRENRSDTLALPAFDHTISSLVVVKKISTKRRRSVELLSSCRKVETNAIAIATVEAQQAPVTDGSSPAAKAATAAS